MIGCCCSSRQSSAEQWLLDTRRLIISSGRLVVVCNLFIFMSVYILYVVCMRLVFHLCHWLLQICCMDSPASCWRRGTARRARFRCGSSEPFTIRCVTPGKRACCSVTSVSMRMSSAMTLQITCRRSINLCSHRWGHPCFHADCRRL